MNRCVLLLCLVPILALAGCGGARDDAAEIEQAIRTAALVHEPAECAEVATQAFLKQVSGRTGEAALQICEGEAEDPVSKAESVAVPKVRVRGSEATAEVAFFGLLGSPLERRVVALVNEDGRWKLDEVISYSRGKIDRQEAQRRIAELGSSREIGCVNRRIAATSQALNDEIDLTRAFSSARSDAQTSGCYDSEFRQPGAGREVAPKGAQYSYRVPPGFRVKDPAEHDGAFTTAVTSARTRNSGAAIIVAETDPIPAADQLLDTEEVAAGLVAFEDVLSDKYGDAGSSLSGPTVSTVAGYPASRWTLTGGEGQVFPGTDEERITILSYVENRMVVVNCSWGRTATERRTIRRGCEALLRSLRIP